MSSGSPWLKRLAAAVLVALVALCVGPPVAAQIEGDQDADIVQDGDNDGDVDQGGSGRSGDGAAGAQITGLVVTGGSTTVRKSNTSEDSEATSGDSDVTSEASASVGPRVAGEAVDCDEPLTPGSISGDDIAACIVQDGDNEAETAQESSAASGDAIAGSQVSGVVSSGVVEIDVTNVSEDAESTSGDADALQGLTASVGPALIDAIEVAGSASIDVGDLDADIVQDGDNGLEVAQTAAAASGDAVAGSQVAGVVSSGGTTRIAGDNTSEDAESTSGDALATNVYGTATAGDVEIPDLGLGELPLVIGDLGLVPSHVGPIAVEGGVLGLSISGDTITAGVVQDGDNDADVDQAAAATTGDAVAGAQVFGAVNAGGDMAVSATNDSEDDEATSGDSTSTNAAVALAAPAGGVVTPGGGSVASIDVGELSAGIVQDGDNEVEIAQDAAGASGDAVAGGQIVGLVGAGDADLTLDNTSEDGEAVSGDATSTNVGFGLVLPVGVGGAEVAPLSIDLGTGGAGNVQDGDNSVELGQSAAAATGDAVAGGSVLGGVLAAGSSLTGSVSNAAEDAEATSGDADATNVAVSLAAPVGIGVGIDDVTLIASASIDAGLLGAGVVHDGDNELSSEQSAAAASGDAVAGGQVAGAVLASGGSTALDLTNSSEDDEATSGDAAAANAAVNLLLDVGVGVAAEGALTTSIDADVLGAGIVRDGDNELDVTQDAAAATGDAVAGGQVVGSVGAGDAAITADNTSEDGEATTGDATATNTGANFLLELLDIGVGADVETASVDAGILGAGVAHDGDNELDVAQNAAATTGDAVAAGQVAGVVTAAGGEALLDLASDSEDAEATSGDSTAVNNGLNLNLNLLAIGVGAEGPITASIEGGVLGVGIAHEGDNEFTVDQDATAATGDAVAGGQVAGVVGAGSTSIVGDNVSEDAEATSGDADAANTGTNLLLELVVVGVGADVGTGSISGDIVGIGTARDGDKEFDVAQAAAATSGDAVAGGQVAGSVTAAGATVALDLSNASEDDEATSGDAAATNDGANIDLNIVAIGVGAEGPILGSIEGDVLGIGTAHDGDDTLEVAQSAAAATGDAVAGAQVAGVVSAGDVSIVGSNTSEDSESTSGDATASNGAVNLLLRILNVGVAVDDAAGASISGGTLGIGVAHEGDNDLVIDQTAAAGSGDAVAGGQVAGVVAAAGGDAALDLSNASEDAESTSGDADSTNAGVNLLLQIGIGAGGDIPAGLGAASIEADLLSAGLVHDGDNTLEIAQTAGSTTGDAVAGGQVAGVVGAGSTSIVAENASEDAEATSGDATASNLGVNVQLDIGIGVDSGLGAIGGLPIGLSISADEIDAGVLQDGDNDLVIDQTAGAASGDAVAGGSIFGVVTADGGDVAIDATNASEDDEAVSGDADAANAAIGLLARIGVGVPAAGSASIEGGDIVAGYVHDGDNEVELAQDAGATTGDAVAGGQIAGVVAAGAVDLALGNTSEDSEATSGDADSTNGAVGAVLLAGVEGDLTASITADTIAAGFVHEGDNDLALDQSASTTTGDAVAGGQVAGVVSAAGSAVTADLTNRSEDAESTSGDGSAANTAAAASAVLGGADAVLGADIDAGAIDAVIVHDGDNETALDQNLSVGTGDALAGSQVLGVVAAGVVDVVQDNTSEDDESATGDVSGSQTLASLVGPSGDAELLALLEETAVALAETDLSALLGDLGTLGAIGGGFA